MVLFLLSITYNSLWHSKTVVFQCFPLAMWKQEFQRTALGVLELAKRLIFVTVVFKFEANWSKR